jgi:broad specificity phosphatase PhoE
MKYLLIRHAKTDANVIRSIKLGEEGAPLNELGEGQARSLAVKLKDLGVNTDVEPVAASELLRAVQTAELAGFKKVESNSLLNEITIDDPESTRVLISQAKVPTQAKEAAQRIIRNPPKQKIWVTHGLVITALLVELGLDDPQHFIPDYCEILEIEF